MSCAVKVVIEQGVGFGRTRKVRSPFLQMSLEDHAEAMVSNCKGLAPVNLGKMHKMMQTALQHLRHMSILERQAT